MVRLHRASVTGSFLRGVFFRSYIGELITIASKISN